LLADGLSGNGCGGMRRSGGRSSALSFLFLVLGLLLAFSKTVYPLSCCKRRNPNYTRNTIIYNKKRSREREEEQGSNQ